MVTQLVTKKRYDFGFLGLAGLASTPLGPGQTKPRQGTTSKPAKPRQAVLQSYVSVLQSHSIDNEY